MTIIISGKESPRDGTTGFGRGKGQVEKSQNSRSEGSGRGGATSRTGSFEYP